VLPELVAALRNEYWDVRYHAGEALRKCGSKAISALLIALKDEHYWSRLHAARTLGHIGPPAQAAVPALAKLLRCPEADIRAEAAEALARIGGIEGVRDELLAALPDANSFVRTAVAEALGRGGPAAVPGLVQTIEKHSSAEVHDAAMRALAIIGPDAAAAVPALLRVLRAEVAEVNRTYGGIPSEGIRNSRIGHAIRESIAVMALGRMGTAAARPLGDCLREADQTLVRYALESLARLGPAAAPVSREVLTVLRTNPDPWQQARAANVLGAIGGDDLEVLAALEKAAASDADVLRRAASAALARLRPSK